MPENETQEKYSNIKSGLEILRNSVFFISIFLYFSGFIYTYHYFNAFNIPMHATEIPIYSYFIYSYSVISDYWLVITLFIILSAIIVSLIHKFIILKFKVSILKYLMLVVLIILFPFLACFSYKSALNDVNRTRNGCGTHRIKFILDEKSTFPKKFKDENVACETMKDCNLQLITTTSEDFYVLYQGQVPERLPAAMLYIIPKKSVKNTIIHLPDTKMEACK